MVNRPTTVEQWAEEAWLEFTHSLESIMSDEGVSDPASVERLLAVTVANTIHQWKPDMGNRQTCRIFDKVVDKAMKLNKARPGRYHDNPPMVFAAVYLLTTMELGLIKRPIVEKVLDLMEPVIAEKEANGVR